MIPGAYERRGPAGPVEERAAAAPRPLGGSHLPTVPVPIAPRVELPSWMRITFFAVALLAVTWLAMFVKSAAR
jgi:hypothetical protein